MSKTIPQYTRYEIDKKGVVRNKFTKKELSVAKGQVCLTRDTGSRSRRSVKALLKEVGYLK